MSRQSSSWNEQPALPVKLTKPSPETGLEVRLNELMHIHPVDGKDRWILIHIEFIIRKSGQTELDYMRVKKEKFRNRIQK